MTPSPLRSQHWRRVVRLLAASLGVLALASAVVAAPAWSNYAGKPEGWYRSEEGRRTADIILSWQSPAGSWPKNTDTTAKAYQGASAQLRGTFDNGATTGELQFLGRAIRATGDRRYREAFLRGLAHILGAQYPTGGWPQFFPPGNQYHRHITFNDNTMVRLMRFVSDVGRKPEYEFVPADQRQAARAAFDRGIQCILKCQITAGNRLTVWCAQHDEVDLRPRAARTYELVSLSGAESASILDLLMSLEKPEPAVARAIEAGAAWYEASKLTGIQQTKVNGDKRIVPSPSAPPLWARFYEIESNRPIFSGRDGRKKYDLAEIEAERRNGYAWYGNWGESVAKGYAQWKKRHP